MTVFAIPVAAVAMGYLVTLLVFGALDALWLAVVAKRAYRRALGHLLAARFKIAAALAFYLIYALGLVVFAVVPALAPVGTSSGVLISGAALGFFCYATYDLTNLATLERWPLGLALVDMAWGAGLSGVAAAIGWQAARLAV